MQFRFSDWIKTNFNLKAINWKVITLLGRIYIISVKAVFELTERSLREVRKINIRFSNITNSRETCFVLNSPAVSYVEGKKRFTGNNVFQKQNKRAEGKYEGSRRRKKQGRRRTWRRKEKSIQGAPTQPRGGGFLSNCLWFLRLIREIWMPLGRAPLFTAKERTIRKSSSVNEGYPCDSSKKLVTSASLFPPRSLSLLLASYVKCQKKPIDNRNVDWECRRIFTQRRNFSSVHRDIRAIFGDYRSQLRKCLLHRIFGKAYFFPSAISFLSARKDHVLCNFGKWVS